MIIASIGHLSMIFHTYGQKNSVLRCMKAEGHASVYLHT